MDQKAVITRNIRMSFPYGEDRTIEVLHGIDMTVHNGEMTMLVGPSGCGKTTLLSIICGILTPDSGEVFLHGTDVHALSPYEKVLYRRRNIGFIFQQFNLLPALTAAENAAVPLVADGVPLEEAAMKAVEVFEFLGMADHAYKLPSQLSGGQQQRVAIARALVHNPRLIICDEPTSSLDAHTGQVVMDQLRQVAKDKERSVIVVTHDPRIYQFADRIFTMGDGMIDSETTNTGELGNPMNMEQQP